MFFKKNLYFQYIEFAYCKNVLLGVLTFGVCVQFALCQTYSPILEDLETLSKRNLFDLIYIQTSKGVYEVGEDLWFKAYVLDNQFFTPSEKSKVLHVKFFNEDSFETVWEEKYENIGGFADGHIYIADTLKNGTYRLVAFTENSGYINQKYYQNSRKLKIVNSILDKQDAKKEYAKVFNSLLLFPEGGDLIANLNNRVAFKALDSANLPVNISGALLMDGVPQLQFSSENDGMGSFDFVPRTGKHYTVKIDQDLENRVFPISKSLSTGAVLKYIESTKGTLKLRILNTGDLTDSKFYIRIQVRGVSYRMVESKFKDSLDINLRLNDIPQGIAEVTLFNDRLQPMSERLVYVNLEQRLHIETEFSHAPSFNKRDKVILKLKVTDANENPIRANLGISIHDNGYTNTEDPKNIFTHYYLSSALQGKIHNPQMYFDTLNPNRNRALDLLLMTNGWRRYTWRTENLKQLPILKRPLVSDSIQGFVYRKRKNQKGNFPVVLAYNPVHNNQIDFISPNESTGNFHINPRHLKMGNKGYLYLRVPSTQKSKFKVIIGYTEFNKWLDKKKLSYPTLSIDSITEPTNYLSAPTGTIGLKEVSVKSKKRNPYREKYFGTLDSLAKTINPDYVCKYNILNCEYHVDDRENRKPKEGEVYFYMEVWDDNRKTWIKGHKDILGAEVFRNPPLPPYKYPRYTALELLELFGIVRIKGFYGKREFYQPKHDIAVDPFPDYRNTLLWEPSLITDENGEAKLEFFCSDISTLFIGNIEGVDTNGLIGKHSFSFQVKR